MKMPKGPIAVWLAINKNGDLQLFSECPTRGKISWVGKNYINSMIYGAVLELVKNSTLSWESEPEFLEFSLKKDKSVKEDKDE